MQNEKKLWITLRGDILTLELDFKSYSLSYKNNKKNGVLFGNINKNTKYKWGLSLYDDNDYCTIIHLNISYNKHRSG